MPRAERDLLIAAKSQSVLAFDNMSGLPDWMSDALCRLASGGGIGSRKLHSDGDEYTLYLRRPILLNGITDTGTRPDLIDRSIVIELPRMTGRRRATEDTRNAKLVALRPLLLGALLTLVSNALRNFDTTNIGELPRMADFAKWVAAGLSGSEFPLTVFLDAYRRITFMHAGKQKSLRLGKVDAKHAAGVLLHVERLIQASITGQAVPSDTAGWLAGRDDAFHDRIARCGLAAPRVPATAAPVVTLAGMIDAYITRRQDVKPSTKAVWQQARRHACIFFGDDKPINAITPADADDFRRYLRGKCSTAYTARQVMVCKTLFRDAVRRKLLAQSPFADVKNGSQSNAARRVFVPRDVIDAIIAACPDPQWKLLIALARYCGLRVPSEPLALKWEHVDWERKRLTVPSPKTAHHEGRESRVCPLFPEVEAYLLAVYEQADPGSVYVITRYRDSTQNLRTQFERYIRQAGHQAWPKLWQNLRASRATELADAYSSHVAAAWLGHTEQVADQHYRQVTDDHFTAAVTTNPPSTMPAAQKAAQQPAEMGRSVPLAAPDTPKNVEKPEKEGEESGRYRMRTCPHISRRFREMMW